MRNGDVTSTVVPLLRDRSILDHSRAEEVLQTKFRSRDGLDIETLLDSAKNGALTYNDILVLPGYIGIEAALLIGLAQKADRSQALEHRKYLSIRQSQNESRSKPLFSPRRWTLSQSIRWQYTWRC